MRNPVEVIARSTFNEIADSTVSGHQSGEAARVSPPSTGRLCPGGRDHGALPRRDDLHVGLVSCACADPATAIIATNPQNVPLRLRLHLMPLSLPGWRRVSVRSCLPATNPSCSARRPPPALLRFPPAPPTVRSAAPLVNDVPRQRTCSGTSARFSSLMGFREGFVPGLNATHTIGPMRVVAVGHPVPLGARSRLRRCGSSAPDPGEECPGPSTLRIRGRTRRYLLPANARASAALIPVAGSYLWEGSDPLMGEGGLESELPSGTGIAFADQRRPSCASGLVVPQSIARVVAGEPRVPPPQVRVAVLLAPQLRDVPLDCLAAFVPAHPLGRSRARHRR